MGHLIVIINIMLIIIMLIIMLIIIIILGMWPAKIQLFRGRYLEAPVGHPGVSPRGLLILSHPAPGFPVEPETRQTRRKFEVISQHCLLQSFLPSPVHIVLC